MLWIALSLSISPSPPPPEPATTLPGLQALSWWALRYSPRVCVVQDRVLIEASGSERLFDGRRALLRRLREEAADQEVAAMAVAPTALAALGLLHTLDTLDTPEVASEVGVEAPAPRRVPIVGCSQLNLRASLDALPVFALAAARPFAATLVRLGCARLGPLRALPRGGVSRRFGAGLLQALDEAYGQAPSSFEWTVLPEQFRLRLEFSGRIEVAAGLMFGANRLLRQLQAWLLARQCGATGVVLHWEHDLQRRSEAAHGTLTVRTAEATRDTAHLAKLLAEHLDRTPLAAPVVAITLEAIGVEARPDATPSLLPEDQARGESLQQLVERLSARLGAHQVLRPQALADHRPQHMQAWRQAATTAPLKVKAPPTAPTSPTSPTFPAALAQQAPWLLRAPLALAQIDGTPQWQGPLALLAGPERIEAGWWDNDARQPADPTARDYFLAQSEQAGLVWVYRELRSSEASRQGWFLHGVYG